MSKHLNVLILEDSPNDALLTLRELRRGGVEVDYLRVDNADALRAALQAQEWDIVLTDYSMPGFDALEALKILRDHNPDLPVILVSGTVGEEAAVAAMKAGANDFFSKDKLARLVPAVERELRDAAGRRQQREIEVRFSKVFDAAPVGIAITRLSDGLALDVNDHFLSIFGYSRAEVVGQSSTQLDLWRDPEQRAALITRLLETGSVRGVEVSFKRTDGSPGFALLAAEMVQLDNERCILTMIQDITDRKQAENALQLYAERLEFLHAIDQAILQADRPETIAQVVLARLEPLMGFHSASVTTVDLMHDQLTVLAASRAIPNDFAVGSTHPIRDHDAIEVLQRNDVYRVDDLTRKTDIIANAEALIAAGVRSYVRIPMVVSGTLLGSINCRASRINAFDPKVIAIAREVAAQLAIAIENARLLEVEQRRISELTALHQVSLQLTGTLDLRSLLATTVRNALDLMDAQMGHIFLHEDGKLFFGAAEWGGQARAAPAATPKPQGLHYAVVQLGQRVIIPDMQRHPLNRVGGQGAAVGLPLRAADEVIGVMSLTFSTVRHFEEHELYLLELLADQAAIAIRNAQLYEQVRLHAVELEQRVSERTAELQDEKDRVEAILNSSSDAIMLIGADGSIQRTNLGARHQLGYQEQELVGQPLTTLFAQADIGRVQQAWAQVLDGKTQQRMEVTARRKDQSIFPADIVLSSFVNGTEGGAVCSLRDITWLKQVEDDLRAALEKERELSELRSRFVSMVSHDFRTPLTVIQASANLLQRFYDRLDPEKRDRHFAQIDNQIQRMVQLLEDVLSISRAEVGVSTFTPIPTDLDSFCRKIAEEFQSVPDMQHSLIYTPPAQPVNAPVDEKLLHQALVNLLTNAFKYSPEGSRVYLDLFAAEEHAVIQVKDNGIGIPAADQPLLFEMFHRASNVGSISGTGIGMSIVKRSIDAHGGIIEFESEENKGTVFAVKLPLHPAR